MVEKQKEEGESKNEVKEKKKKEEEPQEIVLKVDMHCEGCARKVAKSLRGIEGVEEVKIDSKARMVVVKGKTADPLKVCERVQKKTRRKVEIISPLPKPPAEEKKEEAKEAPPEEKKEEPKPITVTLKVRMHCEACAQVLQKRIKKINGVESVETDFVNEQVTVKGFVDPTSLIEDVYRRTKKQASIVPMEEKKEEENKPSEEKKEEKSEEEKKEETKEEDDGKFNAKKLEYLPPKLFLEYAYAYPPEIFSDENPNACCIV
ncbi:heavy metal-associated isoprenylated plant protein 7-like isoform X1 [Dendrobium catenatum]|uniref:heavy metal-associated isoprenylated plant protein 7-like isoform X1 n=1 Tax=Dendrobium catenatum TaxID=906689 RepID=UPI0009F338A1|nr:heavy metal-associated isoprenylated plant protein 7-like isoform X1 [Dendrobium catenatum]